MLTPSPPPSGHAPSGPVPSGHVPSGHVPSGQSLHKISRAALGELRGLAARIIKHERPDHTLQATALLHEAFLRLAPLLRHLPERDEERRALFARTMRRILIDHARRRGVRRAAEVSAVTRRKNEHELAAATQLQDAMIDLENRAPRGAAMIAMRFFDGMSTEEIASQLGLSQRTVGRDWSLARAWLGRIVKGGKHDGV